MKGSGGIYALRQLAGRVGQSRFVRDVGSISAGTLAAQAINVVSIPILTRLYSPAEFGLLGLFYAVTMIAAPAIAAKYDESIIVVEPRGDVKHAVTLSILCSVVLSLLSLAVIVGAEVISPGVLERIGLGNAAFLMPAVLVLHGIYNTGIYYGVREKLFANVAQIKVLQAIAVAVASVAFFFAGVTKSGLVLGLLTGLVVSTAILYQSMKIPFALGDLRNPKVLVSVAQRYRGFPTFSAPGAVFNGLGYHLPMLAISKFFPQSVAGHYALITRVAFAPLGFLSVGIGHVHVRKVAELASAERPILPYLLRISGAFAALVAIPSVIMVLWAPPIFAFVFGEAWREAGTYLQILMPALAIRLVVTTFGGTLEATCNNALALAWKVLAFVSTLGVFLWFGPMQDIVLLLKAQLVNDVILYAIYYALIVYAASKPRTMIRPPAHVEGDVTDVL